MKVWIHEKTHGEHVKHNCKPNIASGMATHTLLNVHIVITIYLYQIVCVKVAVAPALE